jgi:kynurenine formamidase
LKAPVTAVLRTAARDFTVDLSSPVSLALELDFGVAEAGVSRPQPRHFDAPAATSRPYAVPGFSGSVRTGASCNCDVITVIPHCNGTHTECAGHLTREPLDAYPLVPAGLMEALLLTVAPVPTTQASGESTVPTPHAGDRMVTRGAIENAWAAHTVNTLSRPLALVIRTRQRVLQLAPRNGDPAAGAEPPAYLTQEAATLLVERGIEHLVIDLPSIDREHDEGRLTAHRIFFGLPPGSRELAQATRRHATVTELADVPNDLEDGPYLLAIHVPAWRGDAVPSRPLLYPVQQ